MLAARSGHALPEEPIAGRVRNQIIGVREQVRVDACCGEHFVRINSEPLENSENLRSTADAERCRPRLSLACPIAQLGTSLWPTSCGEY